jgi:hypothetical protein
MEAIMKKLIAILTLSMSVSAFALETHQPLLAQMEPTKQVDAEKAKPRVMPMYEQGWNEGAKVGDANAGKIGWFFAGFGNVPFLWLPFTVEPRRPAKPNIQAEEEYNSGYKFGYRAGWKNAHKTYYIAGAIVESVAAGAIILSQSK